MSMCMLFYVACFIHESHAFVLRTCFGREQSIRVTCYIYSKNTIILFFKIVVHHAVKPHHDTSSVKWYKSQHSLKWICRHFDEIVTSCIKNCNATISYAASDENSVTMTLSFQYSNGHDSTLFRLWIAKDSSQLMMTSSNRNISALLSLCAGNPPVTGDFLAQRPMTRSFDIFFDLRLNKRLTKQTWGGWFEMSTHPLWRHCNARGRKYYGGDWWCYNGAWLYVACWPIHTHSTLVRFVDKYVRPPGMGIRLVARKAGPWTRTFFCCGLMVADVHIDLDQHWHR